MKSSTVYCMRMMHVIEGELLHQITKGFFTGVARHADRYYAVNDDTCTVHVYQHSAQWTECHSFSLNATTGWAITVSISNDLLYACLCGDHRVDVLSLSGTLQFSTGSEGYIAAGRLKNPFMCATDSAGTALIADFSTSRLQIMSARCRWSTVTLQPPVMHPRSALLLNDKLFVTDYSDNSLSIYTPL